MTIKVDKSLKLQRGVTVRKNRYGVPTSIQICFKYKGHTCREKVNYPLTQQGVNSAIYLLGKIKTEIQQGTFYYADHFPNSNRLTTFGHAKRGAVIADYLNKVIKNSQQRELAKSTITGYEKAHSALKALWTVPVGELTLMIIINFLKAQNWSSKTSRNRISVLSKALDLAVIDELITSNPLKKLKLSEHVRVNNKVSSRGKHEDVNPFSPAEIEKILGAASGTDRAIIALCNDTGLRSSEWVALKKEDVCFVSKTISIYEAIVEGVTKDPKSKSGKRTIPVSDTVMSYLEEEMNSQDSEYVFLNKKGNHFNQDSFRKHRWSKVIGEAGVKYRYPYQLRHTFASRLISEGENVWKVSKLLGHKSPETVFKHYAQYIEAYEKKVETLR
ncbi:site-specific integrase [Pseudoalteromonas sp. T1lg22]|uniref:site-specific integrase n=1 Tax=Pseudoalteromonas sp. T1lg22 TaxID=2077096 RepID=UPI000CF71597|nr:site-specific integrase [Pseudoalteromonas sp. T1lg22]